MYHLFHITKQRVLMSFQDQTRACKKRREGDSKGQEREETADEGGRGV
jgi:hypothetical protein